MGPASQLNVGVQPQPQLSLPDLSSVKENKFVAGERKRSNLKPAHRQKDESFAPREISESLASSATRPFVLSPLRCKVPEANPHHVLQASVSTPVHPALSCLRTCIWLGLAHQTEFVAWLQNHMEFIFSLAASPAGEFCRVFQCKQIVLLVQPRSLVFVGAEAALQGGVACFPIITFSAMLARLLAWQAYKDVRLLVTFATL